MNRLFVYGTLKNSRIKEAVPEIAPFIKVKVRGFVRGKLFDTGDYPAAVPDKGGRKKVYGEILEITDNKLDEVLKILDEYEEYSPRNIKSSLFVRDAVNVNTRNDKQLKSWIYWFNGEIKNLKEIKDGIYRKRRQNLSA